MEGVRHDEYAQDHGVWSSGRASEAFVQVAVPRRRRSPLRAESTRTRNDDEKHYNIAWKDMNQSKRTKEDHRGG